MALPNDIFSGPDKPQFAYLHHVSFKGVPCLADDQGRIIGFVKALEVSMRPDDVLSAKLELILSKAPEK
jgi:hypothetical protein